MGHDLLHINFVNFDVECFRAGQEHIELIFDFAPGLLKADPVNAMKVGVGGCAGLCVIVLRAASSTFSCNFSFIVIMIWLE